MNMPRDAGDVAPESAERVDRFGDHDAAIPEREDYREHGVLREVVSIGAGELRAVAEHAHHVRAERHRERDKLVELRGAHGSLRARHVLPSGDGAINASKGFPRARATRIAVSPDAARPPPRWREG
ncbi:MAG: hypothetical protein R3B70_22490 [Polyangiaceae bacterium]